MRKISSLWSARRAVTAVHANQECSHAGFLRGSPLVKTLQNLSLSDRCTSCTHTHAFTFKFCLSVSAAQPGASFRIFTDHYSCD